MRRPFHEVPLTLPLSPNGGEGKETLAPLGRGQGEGASYACLRSSRRPI